MDVFDRAGLTWHEETVTDVLLQHTWPLLRGITFNRNQEGDVGADWLWWWIDNNAAFGMLVQAKRLKLPSATVDVGYRKGQQWASLIDAAKTLDVAPVYAVYTGTPASRGGLSCERSGHTDSCEWCRAATVTLFPALVAEYRDRIRAPFRLSTTVPLEFLADATAGTRPLRVRNDLPDALHSFLIAADHGVRGIARSLVSIVMNAREGQLGLVTDVPMTESTTPDPYFSDLPSDQGHMVEPVFPNILRGLRRTPPGYALDVLHGNPLTTELPEDLGGVVVVELGASQG